MNADSRTRGILERMPRVFYPAEDEPESGAGTPPGGDSKDDEAAPAPAYDLRVQHLCVGDQRDIWLRLPISDEQRRVLIEQHSKLEASDDELKRTELTRQDAAVLTSADFDDCGEDEKSD